jgi:hypothetical protein
MGQGVAAGSPQPLLSRAAVVGDGAAVVGGLAGQKAFLHTTLQLGSQVLVEVFELGTVFLLVGNGAEQALEILVLHGNGKVKK